MSGMMRFSLMMRLSKGVGLNVFGLLISLFLTFNFDFTSPAFLDLPYAKSTHGGSLSSSISGYLEPLATYIF